MEIFNKMPGFKLLRLLGFKLLGFKWFCCLLESIPPISRFVNSTIINYLVTRARTRPHPYNTVYDYVSWRGLTDKTWSARHLPAFSPTVIPNINELADMFKRPGNQKQRLCPKSTCLFPAFAQYLTDGFIRSGSDITQPNHHKRNTSTHNIDLCTLYGRTHAQTRQLRKLSQKKGERGLLKSQLIKINCLQEEYALYLFENGVPDPQFHELDKPLGLKTIIEGIDEATDFKTKQHHIARRDSLFAFGGDRVNAVPQTTMINTLLLREHNRLAKELSKQHDHWNDDRVFETARNIVIVEFIKIVVEDYINHISPIEFNLKADPRVAWHANWNKPNWITTEFSLLYRWHSLIPDCISWGSSKIPVHLTFMNNNPLLSIGLAQGFLYMSQQPAGELCAFNTTEELLNIEVDAIKQGRDCDLAPIGEYFEYLGRNKPENIHDITKNKRISGFLTEHYGQAEHVEFYIGLFAEDRVPNSPLPKTILEFVAIDAFSQALTNPLLSEHVFNTETFTEYGMNEIAAVSRLKDLVIRNTHLTSQDEFISMTRAGFRRE